MPAPTRTADLIREDLELRGVPRAFSGSLSDQLAPVAARLPSEAYEAVLAGVAMAYGTHRRHVEADGRSPAQLEEMQRLMGEFADELRKLDEALEMLAAYLTRMRAQSGPRARLLH